MQMQVENNHTKQGYSGFIHFITSRTALVSITISYFWLAVKEDGVTNRITWYQAQNFCAEQDSHLVTQELELELKKLPKHAYWIGMYYQPWIWVTNGGFNSSIY